MTNRLQELLEEAKKTVQTPQEKEEQRRSFAYGNTKIGNPCITREMVDRAAGALDKAAADSSPSAALRVGMTMHGERGQGSAYEGAGCREKHEVPT